MRIKMNLRLRLAFAGALACCLAMHGTAFAADAAPITIKGSDTMVVLGQRWAEEYMNKHTGTTVQLTGGGSGTGISALSNGTTDVCEVLSPEGQAIVVKVGDFPVK